MQLNAYHIALFKETLLQCTYMDKFDAQPKLLILELRASSMEVHVCQQNSLSILMTSFSLMEDFQDTIVTACYLAEYCTNLQERKVRCRVQCLAQHHNKDSMTILGFEQPCQE